MVQGRHFVSAGFWGLSAMAAPAFRLALSTGPIQIVVFVADGGGADLIARMLGQTMCRLSLSWVTQKWTWFIGLPCCRLRRDSTRESL
jgi:tripartite-type tricarboxylate transporter receptor subunit TctC